MVKRGKLSIRTFVVAIVCLAVAGCSQGKTSPSPGFASQTIPPGAEEAMAAATTALQELVAALIARTQWHEVSNDAGAANIYLTYVDEGLRRNLVAYRAAKEQWSAERTAQSSSRLEKELRDRNEMPVLLFIQPAEGVRTTVSALHLGCHPVGCARLGHESLLDPLPDYEGPRVPDAWEQAIPSDSVEYVRTGGLLSPKRFDSVFRHEITSDAVGLFYFPELDRRGERFVDSGRDTLVAYMVQGEFSDGRTHFNIATGFRNKVPFCACFYVDLQATDASLALLPDAVAGYMIGEKPLRPTPSGFDVTIEWDLTARDVIAIIDLLFKFLTLVGVGQ